MTVLEQSNINPANAFWRKIVIPMLQGIQIDVNLHDILRDRISQPVQDRVYGVVYHVETEMFVRFPP